MRVRVDARTAGGDLQHYAAIQRRPGFTLALADLIGELKRFRIEPPEFAASPSGAAS